MTSILEEFKRMEGQTRQRLNHQTNRQWRLPFRELLFDLLNIMVESLLVYEQGRLSNPC